MKRFWTALGFLTVLPLPPREAMSLDELGKAAVWFPFIGALIGGLVALVNLGAVRFFPR